MSLTGSFALFALIALTSLGLVSCTTASDDPTPSPTRPITETPSATPTPSPSRSAPPDRPEAMARDDLAGAMAAAEYFLELYPYAYNTGDLTEWRAMSHPECIFCASVIENVEKLHSEGGFQTGGEIEWFRTAATSSEHSGQFSVDAVASQAPTHEVVGDTTSLVSEGGAATLYFDLVRDSTWKIRGVDVEATG